MSDMSEALADVREYQRKRRNPALPDCSLFIVVSENSPGAVFYSRGQIIDAIASGSINHVAYITESNAVEGWSSDITADVLDAAETLARDRMRAELKTVCRAFYRVRMKD